MSNYTLFSIDREKLDTARAEGRRRIALDRRRAAEMAVIAREFDGAYVTKAIIPKLKAHFPDANRMYINYSKYTSIVTLTIGYGTTYNEDDEFTICSKEARRIDGKALLKTAEAETADAEARQEALDRLGDTVDRYNAIADAYAEIKRDLSAFFHDLPYADYYLEDKYKGALSPERFAASLPE